MAALRNSLAVAGTTTILCLVFGVLAAYALAQAGTDPEGIAAAINGIRHMDDVVTGPFYAFLGREAIRPVEVQIVQGGAFHFFHTYTDPMIIIPPGL